MPYCRIVFNPMLFLIINSECLYNSEYKHFPRVKGNMRNRHLFQGPGEQWPKFEGNKTQF